MRKASLWYEYVNNVRPTEPEKVNIQKTQHIQKSNARGGAGIAWKRSLYIVRWYSKIVQKAQYNRGRTGMQHDTCRPQSTKQLRSNNLHRFCSKIKTAHNISHDELFMTTNTNIVDEYKRYTYIKKDKGPSVVANRHEWTRPSVDGEG